MKIWPRRREKTDGSYISSRTRPLSFRFEKIRAAVGDKMDVMLYLDVAAAASDDDRSARAV